MLKRVATIVKMKKIILKSHVLQLIVWPVWEGIFIFCLQKEKEIQSKTIERLF
jgi:hypothetical protein